jgi:hypothetical protein
VAWRPEVARRPPSGQDPAAIDLVDYGGLAAALDTACQARGQPWEELMRRAFNVGVLACPRCGGRLRLIALIEPAAIIGRILRHLGLPTELPVARPARAPPLFAAAGEAQADEYESEP